MQEKYVFAQFVTFFLIHSPVYGCRSDKKLKALVYKLVPGLWQSENRRLQKFNEENNIFVDEQTPPQLNSHSHPREHELNGRNGYGLKRVNSGCGSNIGSHVADDDDEHFYSPDDPIR